MGSKSRNPHFTNLQTMFEYEIVSTITVSDTVINKIQRVQNSFIRLTFRLPKYVSALQKHEGSGLPYVRDRLISVRKNHLPRMHANPLVEHTISSGKTNTSWEKHKTAISILKYPTDLLTLTKVCQKIVYVRTVFSKYFPNQDRYSRNQDIVKTLVERQIFLKFQVLV